MKQLVITAAASALLAAMAISAPAYAASDYKMYHGSDCKVFGATAWTDLNFNGFGVRNVQASGRNIICPLVKDMEGSVDNVTNFGAVHIHLFAPPAGGTAVCTVYSTVFEDVTSNTSDTTGGMTLVAGNNLTDLSITTQVAINSYNHEKYFLLCSLGAGVRLTGYSLSESGVAATNTP